MRVLKNSLRHDRVWLLWCAAVAGFGLTTPVHAAEITSLTVTDGEFRMGPFTPLGPVFFTYTGGYDLINDFPTPIGWDVNVGQNTQNGTVPDPTSVVSFPFGDPIVNTFNVVCDPQNVDACDVNPHGPATGTVNGGSATIADGDPIVLEIGGFYANWNGVDFNQGGVSRDGVAYLGQPYEYSFTSTVSNVNGDTFDYDMTWTSLIVGGPFNGQTGTWTFRGSGTVSLVGNPPQTDPGLTLAPNNFAQIAGITTTALTAAGYPQPGADQDCVGGCWDWVVTGLPAPGASANVVVPLGSPIPTPASEDQSLAVWKFDSGSSAWVPFDTSNGDQVRTASTVASVCPPPGDAAYTPGLTSGNNCIQTTIADGGSNDNDGLVNQEIADPGGIVLLTAEKGLTQMSDNGCTIAGPGVSKSKGEWWVIAGFLMWLRVWVSRKQSRR